MSKTYRRIKVKPNLDKQRINPFTGERQYTVRVGHGYDHGHTLFLSVSLEVLESQATRKKILKFYQDVGTRHSFRSLKTILNDRYRRLAKEQLHRALVKDQELILSKHKKFDFGFWFD